jgi:hypothetical protein
MPTRDPTLVSFTKESKGFLRSSKEAHPLGGKGDTPGLPRKELHAKPALEPRYLPRDGTMRDSTLFGGSGK